MRVNLEDDESMVAALPKVWAIALGWRGFFNKNKEGILVLTNKNLIFVSRYLYVSPKEREKYFGEDKVKVAHLWDYSETQLDEDISENSRSWIVPLESIIDITQITLRKVNFMRIKFSSNGKEKSYDLGVAKSVTNYPIRQPLLFYNVDWTAWIDLLKSRI